MSFVDVKCYVIVEFTMAFIEFRLCGETYCKSAKETGKLHE